MTPQELEEQRRRAAATNAANPVMARPLGTTGTPSASGRSINPIAPATNTLPSQGWTPQGSNPTPRPAAPGALPTPPPPAQSQSGLPSAGSMAADPVAGSIKHALGAAGVTGPGADALNFAATWANPVGGIASLFGGNDAPPIQAEMSGLTPEQRAAYLQSGAIANESADGNTGRAGTLGSALATGDNVRIQDPNNPGQFIRVGAAEYLKNQQAQGSPLGMLYGNAAGNGRELALLNAGRDQLNRYNDAAMGAVSGGMGEASMGQGMDQAMRTAAVGGKGFNMAEGSAANMIQAGNAMGQDVQNLRAAAAGTVPSAAAIQQRQGIGDAIAAQQALAAGARGGNMGLASRTAAAQGASVTSRGLGDAAALRAQEQATARGQLTQAQSTQGGIFGQAGQVATAAGAGRTNASSQAAAGLLQGGSEILGSQFKGMDALSSVERAEFERMSGAIGRDQVDQEALQEYLFNMMNVGMGQQANVHRTNTEAATAARGQAMQLGGAAVGAAGGALSMGMR